MPVSHLRLRTVAAAPQQDRISYSVRGCTPLLSEMPYAQANLEAMTVAALKNLAAELGVEVEGDKRKKSTWLAAILSAQTPEAEGDTTIASEVAAIEVEGDSAIPNEVAAIEVEGDATIASEVAAIEPEPSPLLSIQIGTIVAHRDCPSQAIGTVYRFFTFERVGIRDESGCRSCLIKNLVALPPNPTDARAPPSRVRR